MGFGILHMQKIHGGNLSALGSHIYRDRGKEGTYSNPDIDFSKTAENRILFRRAGNLEKAVNEHIIEIFRRKEIERGKRIDPLHPEKAKKRAVPYDAPIKIKDNAVRCVAFLVTASPEVMKSWSREKQDKYFEQATTWLAKRYGEQNLMYAVIHRDEANPHMHLGLVPMTTDNRLCAYELFSRWTLQALQEEFWQEVARPYGLNRGESTVLTHRKHLDEAEYKIKAENEKLLKRKQELEQQVARAESDYEIARACLVETEKRNEAAEKHWQEMHPPLLEQEKKKIMDGHSKQRAWGSISSHHALTDAAWQSCNNVLASMDGYVYRTKAAEAQSKKLQAELSEMQSQMTQVDSARQWALDEKAKIEREAATYLTATQDERIEADELLNARARERYEASRRQQEELKREREAKQKSRGGWSR